MRLANQVRHPVVLEDGTVLAAAGTDGAVKEVGSISEADRARYLDNGLVADIGEATRPGEGEVHARDAQTPAVSERANKLTPPVEPVELGTQRHAGSPKERRKESEV